MNQVEEMRKNFGKYLEQFGKESAEDYMEIIGENTSKMSRNKKPSVTCNISEQTKQGNCPCVEEKWKVYVEKTFNDFLVHLKYYVKKIENYSK
jgi:hypothetical protein